jgi:hypothetical protein
MGLSATSEDWRRRSDFVDYGNEIEPQTRMKSDATYAREERGDAPKSECLIGHIQ